MSYEITVNQEDARNIRALWGASKTIVFQELHFKSNGFGEKEFWHSVRSISAACGLDKNTVQKYANELVTDGLFRKRIGENNRRNRITYYEAVTPTIIEFVKQARLWFHKMFGKTASWIKQAWLGIRKDLIQLSESLGSRQEDVLESRGGVYEISYRGVYEISYTKNEEPYRMSENNNNSPGEVVVDCLKVSDSPPLEIEPLDEIDGMLDMTVSVDYLDGLDPKYFPKSLVEPLANELKAVFERDKNAVERFLAIGEEACLWMVWNAAERIRGAVSIEEAVGGTVYLATNKKYPFTKPRSLISYESNLKTKKARGKARPEDQHVDPEIQSRILDLQSLLTMQIHESRRNEIKEQLRDLKNKSRLTLTPYSQPQENDCERV